MKISIVIPTRERLQFLKYSVQTALEIDDPDIEIVISDNASTDGTQEYIASLTDPRITYVNTGGRYSMRENFNTAFLASSGDYLIYFGDDDGIVPGQFKYLRQLLEKHRPDGISWPRVTYGWPVAQGKNKTGGFRITRDDVFGSTQRYQPSDNRENLLQCHLAKLTPMPDLYHGCMSRAYLEKIALRPDLIFDGSIPDFNISYRALLKGGDFLHVGHFFTVSGYSPASTGGGYAASQKGKGSAETKDSFSAENRTDPEADVMAHAGSVPMAFYATLETILKKHGLETCQTDHQAWNHYVLSSARKNPELRGKLQEILGEYARRMGHDDAFEAALTMKDRPKRSLSERLNRLWMQLHSFRVSAEQDGENTILSVVRIVDALLRDDFAGVLDGTTKKSAAWQNTKQRSKSFERQL